MSLLFVVSILYIKSIKSETVIDAQGWFDDFQFDVSGQNGWNIYNGNKYETNYIHFTPQNKITFGEKNRSYHGPFNNLEFFGIWFKRNFSCKHNANIYVAFDVISCENTSYQTLNGADIVSIYKLNSLQDIVIKKNLSQRTGTMPIFNDDIYAENTNIYHCNSYNKWQYKSFNFSFIGDVTAKQKWNLNLKADVTSNSKCISIYNIKIQCISITDPSNQSIMAPTANPTIYQTTYTTMDSTIDPTNNPTISPTVYTTITSTNNRLFVSSKSMESDIIIYGVGIRIMFEYEDDSNMTEIGNIIAVILMDIIDEELIDCDMSKFTNYNTVQLHTNNNIVVVNITIFVCNEAAQQSLIVSDHIKQLQHEFINRLNSYYNKTNRINIEYINPITIYTSTATELFSTSTIHLTISMVIGSVFGSHINPYIVYITLGGIICIAFIIVIIDMVYMRSFNKYGINSTLFFALSACNLLTDSVIAYELWMYYINESMDDLFVLSMSIICSSSVVICFVYNNIFCIMKIYLIPSHLCCLFSYILVIITSDSYVVLRLLSSNMFGINSLHFVDQFKMRNIKIITILIQNMPQITIQSLFMVMILQSVDILIIISIVLSFITLLPHVAYIIFCVQCKQRIKTQYVLKIGMDVKVPSNMNNTSNMYLLSKQLSDILGVNSFEIQIMSVCGSKIKVIHQITKRKKGSNSTNSYIWRLYMNKMDKINTAIKSIYGLNINIETGLIFDTNSNKKDVSPISVFSQSELADVPQTQFSMIPSGTDDIVANTDSKSNHKYNLTIPIFDIHELTSSDDKKKDDIIMDDDEEIYKIGTVPIRKLTDPGSPTPITPIPISPISPSVDNFDNNNNNNINNDNKQDIVLDTICYDVIKEDETMQPTPSPPPQILDNNHNEVINDDIIDSKGDGDDINQKMDTDENKEDDIDTKNGHLISKRMVSADYSTSNDDPEYDTSDTAMDLYQIEEPTETTQTQTISTDPFQHSIPVLVFNDIESDLY